MLDFGMYMYFTLPILFIRLMLNLKSFPIAHSSWLYKEAAEVSPRARRVRAD